MEKYQIFISYRREGGADLAGRITDQLRSFGYKVFFDVETMRSGKFNTQLFEAIDQCSDIVVILPPYALDRCKKKDDWVRQELAYALKKEKNIIPIMMRGFKFPLFLPKDISDIKFMEGIPASNDYFDAVMQKLERLLLSNKNLPEHKTNNHTLANLKNMYIDFIKSITNLEFSNAKLFFEKGNDISPVGEIFLMCQQVLEKHNNNESAQKEFSELLLIFKTIYKLAIEKNQKEICQFMQTISTDEYIAACDDIKAYMIAEVDNLDCEFTNTIFRYISAHQNDSVQKSYWDSLLKEVFRLMKLCDEFDKANNSLETKKLNNLNNASQVNKQVPEKVIDEEKLMLGAFFGFKLGRIEFIWGSEFDFAKSEFETSFKELKVFLDADNVPYDENEYHKFCDSIINYYRVTDAQKLYAILIGIFTQRMTLSCSIPQPEQKEMLHNLAVSALSTIPSSFLSNKKDFTYFVKAKIEDGLEFSEILQEIYRYLVDFDSQP